MGSSPSKDKDPKTDIARNPGTRKISVLGEARERRLRAKVNAMIKFNRHTTRIEAQSGRDRNDVYAFMYQAKEENAKAWDQIQNGESGDDAARYTLHASNYDGDNKNKADLSVSNEPHWKQRLEYGKCDICHMMAANAYPCRICDRLFHRDCLEKSGKYLQGEVGMFLEQAHTYVGWSCFHCDDITHLLTEEEMRTVMELFDAYIGTKKTNDTILSWDEYKAYHEKQHKDRRGDGMTGGDVELLRHKFRLMDLDDSGMVSYYEFMTQEACIKLAARDPRDLLVLLTKKEIGGARNTFDAFDKDNDGVISEQDIKKTYNSWYSSLRDKRDTSEEMDDVVATHVDNQAAIMYDEDARKKGALKWEEYAEKQALYIISSRPNRYTSDNYQMTKYNK